MTRIDPFAIYVGAAGLVIGSIGLAFSGEASHPVPHPPPAMAQVAAPALEPAPVAFYAETVELDRAAFSPARRYNAGCGTCRGSPARPCRPGFVVEVQPRQSERVPAPMRERTRAPAHVVVHKGKSGTELYLVEREAR